MIRQPHTTSRHLDLAEHEAGVPRRAAAVGRIRILPLGELLMVRF